jgi:hypothetical protein
MENKVISMEPLLERVEEYGKTNYELLRLKTVDKTSEVVSGLVSRSIFVILLILFVVIANIGVALWLGDTFGKSYYGFFIVAAFYALMSMIVYFLMHNWIKKQVANSLITSLLN